MGKANRKGRTNGATQPFVQVLKPTLHEPAWKALPYGARCAYITLKSYFMGSNNGRLYLSVRKAAEDLGASPTSTERWFHDLIDHGFIVPTGGGFLGVEGKGTATYWRLTELGCNGEQPTRDFKNWPDLKNKTPSLKKGQTVPKIGTPRPQNRDTCPQNRDGFDPKAPSGCPQNRDVSNIPSTRGKPTRSAADESDPEQALIDRGEWPATGYRLTGPALAALCNASRHSVPSFARLIGIDGRKLRRKGVVDYSEDLTAAGAIDQMRMEATPPPQPAERAKRQA